MRISRGAAAALAVGLFIGIAGCSSSTDSPRTVFVTETAAVADESGSSGGSAGSTTSTGTVASATSESTNVAPTVSGSAETVTGDPVPTGSELGTATPGVTVSWESGDDGVPPGTVFVDVNPLQTDCAKVLNGTTLEQILGAGLPPGTARIVENANPGRKITGRLKCHYGVGEDGAPAVSVVYAQFEDAGAMAAQVRTTVDAESSLGATSARARVQGLPAHMLLRDGGLLVMGYDTWSLSVVAAEGLIPESGLPQALTDLADYVLTRTVS